MLDYSFYPILRGASRTIIQFDEQSILFAQENIEKYTPTRNLEIDIPVWLISTIIIHNLGNNFLTRKFVSNYGKLFESHLLKDIHNKDSRTEILEYLEINKDIQIVQKEKNIKIHMVDYLELSQHVSKDQPKFELVNQDLERGFVYTPINTFCYLCRLVVEKLLFSKIKTGMKTYDKDDRINRIVNELRPKYPEYIKPKNTSIIPPYIQVLIDKAYKENHLNHGERIRLGIYLQKHNFDEEFILNIFKSLSDWNEKITRYQLRSLQKYIR